MTVMTFFLSCYHSCALRFFSSACIFFCLFLISIDLRAFPFHRMATNTVLHAFCSRRKLIWTSKSLLLFKSSLSSCSARMSLAMFR